MPVSKSRKKRQKSGAYQQKKNNTIAPAKKKLSRQQIIIYDISGLMILSLALGLIATGSSSQAAPPTPTGVILQETAVPDDGSGQSPAESAPDTAATPGSDAKN